MDWPSVAIRPASPGASAGTSSVAARNSSRKSSGLGRFSGKSIFKVEPLKLFTSTVCSSFTATVTFSPGFALSNNTTGSRSSPMATRRPLK
jgi:hypothetical protein